MMRSDVLWTPKVASCSTVAIQFVYNYTSRADIRSIATRVALWAVVYLILVPPPSYGVYT